MHGWMKRSNKNVLLNASFGGLGNAWMAGFKEGFNRLLCCVVLLDGLINLVSKSVVLNNFGLDNAWIDFLEKGIMYLLHLVAGWLNGWIDGWMIDGLTDLPLFLLHQFFI